MVESAPTLLEYDFVEGTWPEGIRIRLSSLNRESELPGETISFKTTVVYRGKAGPPPREHEEVSQPDGGEEPLP